MRKHSPSFEILFKENKLQLMKDEEALNEIERRIEERKAREIAKIREAELKKVSSK